jgi:uncharacterized protein
VSSALRFRRHETRLAVCRLPLNEPLPAWAVGGEFLALVRTPTEATAVCEEARVPATAQAERGWAALELAGPFDFAQTGILASVLTPLAEAGIGIFAISTFDTDWILVKRERVDESVRALTAAGHNEI